LPAPPAPPALGTSFFSFLSPPAAQAKQPNEADLDIPAAFHPPPPFTFVSPPSPHLAKQLDEEDSSEEVEEEVEDTKQEENAEEDMEKWLSGGTQKNKNATATMGFLTMMMAMSVENEAAEDEEAAAVGEDGAPVLRRPPPNMARGQGVGGGRRKGKGSGQTVRTSSF
jgi:hypothetical protein